MFSMVTIHADTGKFTIDYDFDEWIMNMNQKKL